MRASGSRTRLDQIGTHPPKRVIDIPSNMPRRYFDMMPFDKELLTDDVPTTLALSAADAHAICATS